MSRQNTSLLSLTLTASGAVTENRFVTPAGAQVSVAGANTLGASRSTVASGAKFTADVLGTAQVEAGAAVAANATVQADASGRAITYASGARAGIALEAATAAGQIIEVLLLQNAA